MKVSGPKTITTTRSKVQIKGTINGRSDSISYRVGKKSWKTKALNGSGKWKISVPVSKGKNKIQIVALGSGGASQPSKVTAIRE